MPEEVHLARQARRRYSTLDNFRPEPANYGKAAVPNQAENVAKVLTERERLDHFNRTEAVP
jgi:hypothetical protein